jgi:dTDP-D-glucose 4,6-dehydratase
VIKRVQDGRRVLLVADEGMAIHSRVAARNAAESILRAVDRPEVANGKRYNVGDDVQYSVRQWVELLLDRMNATADIVSVPSTLAPWVKAMHVPTSVSLGDHNLLDTALIRQDLGYRDVVDIRAGVDELLGWYAANPVDPATSPAFVDRFDYDAEDALVAGWTRALDELRGPGLEVPDDVHPMAHPKHAGAGVDQRGR